MRFEAGVEQRTEAGGAKKWVRGFPEQGESGSEEGEFSFEPKTSVDGGGRRKYLDFSPWSPPWDKESSDTEELSALAGRIGTSTSGRGRAEAEEQSRQGR